VTTIEQNYINTLISLNMILEAKHPYTKGHTNRVVELCIGLGRELGISSGELQDLREGAMLHDIGKLAISDTILNKPGPLSEQEMEIIRQHPVIGDNIIRPIRFLQHCRPVVRHHHERWDGHGYPDGLKGEDIHLFARICTIADTVDAMASARSYRAALTFPEIYDQLLMGSGTQFDENLVRIMLAMVERGEVASIARPRKLVVG
jgi:putative nucleotidyltransferase with HDIG domain